MKKIGIIFFALLAVIGGVIYLISKSKYTTQFDALFVKYAKENGLDWKMLKAVSMVESMLGKYKTLEPIGGTTGLMHIKLDTAKRFIPNVTATELAKDETQIKAAAKYLYWLKNRYKNDLFKTVISYNQGEGKTDKGKDYTKDYYPKYLKYYAEIS